jgi:hypothetical protein
LTSAIEQLRVDGLSNKNFNPDQSFKLNNCNKTLISLYLNTNYDTYYPLLSKFSNKFTNYTVPNSNLDVFNNVRLFKNVDAKILGNYNVYTNNFNHNFLELLKNKQQLNLTAALDPLELSR